MITQLVYTSRKAFDPNGDSGRQHVRDILGSARRFNAEHDITGFLLVGPDWFAQVLEGPAQHISALFRKLFADPRHCNVKLVDTRLIRERRFGGWTMGTSVNAAVEMSLDMLVGETDLLFDSPFYRILALATREAQIATSAL